MADRVPEEIAEAESRPELEGRIDRLQAATDDAAGQVRNLYIAFLSFGLYLAITVGATTDEQLLRESPVRLPIVDVGLPLVAFYWIAPLLFVLFHLNLLMQLYLLSEKLHRLDLAIGRLPDDAQRERRATLSQFVFSQMLIGGYRHPLIRRLLDVIAWTTFVVLPIAVLLLTQIQFLPYHDPFTTWWQRCLIVLDLLLLWLLWLPAIEPTGRLGRQFRVVARRRSRRVLRRLGEPLDWPAWPAVGLLSLIRAAATLPARIRARLRGDPKRDWRLLRLQELSAVALLIALLVAAIPGTFLAAPIDGLIGERGNLGVLNRNLSLREAELMAERPPPGLIENIGEEQAFEKYARGLDLRGRDLRFADLFRADLRKADLRDGASLQGANLAVADLQGADLEGADLKDAVLARANVQDADLSCDPSGRCTNLQRADLRRADLQSADLEGADLQGAFLRWANLEGAKLGRADLQGAKLGSTNLRGADLELADLRARSSGRPTSGARTSSWRISRARSSARPISRARSSGGPISRAHTSWGPISRARSSEGPISSARTSGRPSSRARISGGPIFRARASGGGNLQGADLERAELRGADLEGADLQGAFLWGADLQGGRLWGANLQSAVLWEADLQGAKLGAANLRGADLRGANLQGADLSCNQFGACTDLQGADLRGAQLWRARIGDQPVRDDLWNLVDLRGAGIDPVDVDALVAEIRDQIADEQARAQVTKRLEAALRDDDRPDLPSWRGQPNVMFQDGDPIPHALSWAAPTMTAPEYDEKLATFLGNLACGDDGSPALAQGLARRAVIGADPAFDESDRLLYLRLARRLISDDPEACPAAAELPEDLRTRLVELAARVDPGPADQAEPAPARSDPPLQKPGTPLPEPQTSRHDQ